MLNRCFKALLSVFLCISFITKFTLVSANNAQISVMVDCDVTADEALMIGYINLSDKAKEIYNTLDFNNTNSIYEESFVNHIDTHEVSTSAMSAIDTINQGLNQMGLGSQVIQALTQLASGLIAALGDGPLPIGDIYAIAVGLYTAITLADYLDEINEHWDEIVELFKQSLTETSSTIPEALDIIREDAINEDELPDIIEITILSASRTIRANDEYYVCSIPIANFGPSQERFYPGIIYNGTFWVCYTYVPFKVARAIMAANIELAGILTKYQVLAYNLCSTLGSPYHHDPHQLNNPNYLPHYHFSKLGIQYNSHAWYVSVT